MKIRVHSDISGFKIPDHLYKIADWVCEQCKLYIVSLDIILINDEQLRELHKKYLNDDSYTDVMTFNTGDKNNIEGEIYISVERAAVQAKQYKVSLQEELARLVIHGCLHLAGYDDKETTSLARMKHKENLYVREAIELFLNNSQVGFTQEN